MSIINGLRDFHWILAVLTAYIFHVNKYSCIGFMVNYNPDFPSKIFVLAFAMMLAEYQLWPATLKKPPCTLLLLFEALASAFWTNVARSLIWVPFTVSLKDNLHALSESIVLLNSKLRLHKYSLLYKLSRWLDSECGLAKITLIVALLIFVWVLDATDTIDHAKHLIEKMTSKIHPEKRDICGEMQHPSQPGKNPRPAKTSLSNVRGLVYTILQNISSFVMPEDDYQPSTNMDHTN